MPFDPKLIHAEEPPLTAGGDLDLPADLAALAQQLGDDAAHLSARYPAGPAKAETTTGVRRRAASYVGYAAIGAAVASLLGAIVLWESLAGPPVAKTTTATTAAVAPPVSVPSLSSTPAVAAPRGENVSLVDLTGPEVEALLDLLDRDPGRAGGISF